MKALKHVTAILLTSVGFLFTLGSLVHVLNPDPEVPLWMVGLMFLFLGLLPVGGAFILLRKTVTVPSKSCPQCGNSEWKAAGVLRRAHNPWIFHFGGWLIGSLWGASREQQVRCVQCDKLYLTDTRGTRIAGVLLWAFLLLVTLGLILEHFGG